MKLVVAIATAIVVGSIFRFAPPQADINTAILAAMVVFFGIMNMHK